jgi:hypothetical protein
MNAPFPVSQCGPQTGFRLVTQVFQTPGAFVYQPSPGMYSLLVECQGAGGGGGGAQGSLAGPPQSGSGWTVGGGGGASGNWARMTLPASLVLGGVIVTIGAGGPGGQAVEGAMGGTGGSTSFGAFCMAAGGGGGWAALGTNVGGIDILDGQGGARTGDPSPTGIGELVAWGNAGSGGGAEFYDPDPSGVAEGGLGGGSHYQSAGRSVRQLAPGDPGIFGGFGSGGGGAASSYTAFPAVGGPGGNGLCVVTEYCWIGAGGGDCGCGRVAISRGRWIEE